MFIRKRKIVADDELEPQVTPVTEEPVEPAPAEEEVADVSVEPEAMELLFETDDVAQLLAEVAGEDVEVTVDDETGDTIFAVGEDEYTCTPEEDTEILESTRRTLRGKKGVKASTNRPAAKKSAYRTLRKIPRK